MLNQHLKEEKKYHEIHSKKIIKASEDDLIWHVAENELFIKKYLARIDRWTLLDFGCGSAVNIRRNIPAFLSKKRTYIGVDISKSLIKEAKKNIPQGLFLNKPMSRVRFPKESIDFITFFGSLHHDDDPKKTLKIAATFLKHGGYLFLREPEERAFKQGFGASPYEAGINKEKLKHLCRKNGLIIIEWHFLNTGLFHFVRKVLNFFKFTFLEKFYSFWYIKVKIELFLEKIFNNYLTFFKGTDMFIVLRKE